MSGFEMASLPPAATSGTLKLEAETQRHPSLSLPVHKNQGLSYPRKRTNAQFDGNLDSTRPLDFQGALSMINDNIKVESSCYVPLLQECVDKNLLSNAQSLHAHIIKTGTHQDLFVSTFLVNVYAKCGSMENSRKAFDSLPGRNVVAWTTLMTGYVQNSQPELAIHVFHEMLEVGSYPTNYTLGAALNASSALNSLELGKQIHGYVIKYRIVNDTSVGNSLCRLYSNLGSLDSAIKAFQKIREKNVVSWTTVISACGENGKALKGLRFFIDMLSKGLQPNEFTLTAVLSLCCTMAYLGVGSQLHSLSIKLGHDSNLRIRNSLMYLYFKCGWNNEAEKLFDGIGGASLVTWNALIAGHAQMMAIADDDLSAHCSGTKALKIFSKMQRSGLKPDLYTFSSVLTVCSRLVALEQGKQLHAQTLKTGFLSEVVVGTALVNMYHRCGSSERASKAFLEMFTRTLISWTSMITGLANCGESKRALQLFEDMRMAGVRPNQITFLGVLAACSHAGMVDEALRYLEMMQNLYRIKPLMDQYGCIIEMYVKLGRLDEAFDIVKNMDFLPNEFIWSLLLAGCRNHGKTELGLYAAENLIKLKPKDTDTYKLLLGTYISAENLEKVFEVRKLAQDEKLGALEDWSRITVKDKVHSFKPNDRLHPCTEEIYTQLDELLKKAEANGYEPQLESLELFEKDTEKIMSSPMIYDSEKLAFAFGLLTMPSTAPIRIVKSVSMSRDCHSFMKIASSLTDRLIVVRDSKRLHRFVHGQCSCGDFVCLV